MEAGLLELARKAKSRRQFRLERNKEVFVPPFRKPAREGVIKVYLEPDWSKLDKTGRSDIENEKERERERKRKRKRKRKLEANEKWAREAAMFVAMWPTSDKEGSISESSCWCC